MDTATIDKAVALTKEFVKAATPAVKEAYDVALITIQIDGIQQIMLGLMWLVLSIAAWKMIGRLEIKRMAARNYSDTAEYQMGKFLCWVFSVSLFIGFLVQVLDIWNWVRIFRPDVWLVHAAILKVM